ncbi:AbrB/MazE/SpoVT family DNA-binding domain-containing protein, partial [Candidatus Aerophobetes bacterium]|nr:AbrB/MazE/SpoVT family DNA-binding domain-containing protein [Candidatus Aerophobetes bacterium]
MTIPKEVRKKLKIEPGDGISFSQEGNKVVLRKARVSPVEDFNRLVY